MLKKSMFFQFSQAAGVYSQEGDAKIIFNLINNLLKSQISSLWSIAGRNTLLQRLNTAKSNLNFDGLPDSIETSSRPWYATPYRSDLSICGRQSGGKMAAGAKRGLGTLCNLTAIPLTRKEEGNVISFKNGLKCVFGLAFGTGLSEPKIALSPMNSSPSP